MVPSDLAKLVILLQS